MLAQLEGEVLPFLMRLLFLAAAAGFAWAILRTRWDFSIVVERGSVQFAGKVPQAQRAAISGFLKDCIAEGPVKIRGYKGRGGRLKLAFKGPVDAGTRQQIRNFLVTVL
ncbi:MAG: hypothetical protein WD403_11480 [Pirellulales bacterium]